MDWNEIKLNITGEIIAEYKDWYHVMMFIDHKFSDIFIVKST